jgi:glycerol-3-phosphate cytidylyltransferase
MIKGFACGVFDLFHAGHVLMLKECKEHCDYLLVAVNRAENIDYEINPGKRPPIFSYNDRKLILESCRYIDEVVGYKYEDELIDIMRSRSFGVRFLGEDYKGKPITDPSAIATIHYTDRSHGKSSSNFKKAIDK